MVFLLISHRGDDLLASWGWHHDRRMVRPRSFKREYSGGKWQNAKPIILPLVLNLSASAANKNGDPAEKAFRFVAGNAKAHFGIEISEKSRLNEAPSRRSRSNQRTRVHGMPVRWQEGRTPVVLFAVLQSASAMEAERAEFADRSGLRGGVLQCRSDVGD